jgi:hypothetical protein
MGRAVAFGAFVALSIAAAAVIDGVEGDSGMGITLLALPAACAVAGWMFGSWWAVFLAIVPMLVAIPFGHYDVDRGDVWAYTWVIQLYATPIYVVGFAVGIGLGKLAPPRSGWV